MPLRLAIARVGSDFATLGHPVGGQRSHAPSSVTGHRCDAPLPCHVAAAFGLVDALRAGPSWHVGQCGLSRDGYDVAVTDPTRPDLPGEPADDAEERRRQFEERARAEVIAGAEADSVRRLGRGLTAEELERVLRRYQAQHRE